MFKTAVTSKLFSICLNLRWIFNWLSTVNLKWMSKILWTWLSLSSSKSSPNWRKKSRFRVRNIFLNGGARNPENILCESSWNSLSCYHHRDLGWEFSVQGEILALEKQRVKLVLMEMTFYSTIHVSIWTAEQQDSAFGQIVSQQTQPDHTWSLSCVHILIYICCAPGKLGIHTLHFYSEVPKLSFSPFFSLL